jgi:hypothetical protein
MLHFPEFEYKMHFVDLLIRRNALHRSSACQITYQRLA